MSTVNKVSKKNNTQTDNKVSDRIAQVEKHRTKSSEAFAILGEQLGVYVWEYLVAACEEDTVTHKFAREVHPSKDSGQVDATKYMVDIRIAYTTTCNPKSKQRRIYIRR